MRLFLLTLITVTCSALPVTGKQDADSLHHIVQTTEDDSVKVEAILMLSNLALDYEQAITYAMQALELAKLMERPVLLGKIYNTLGMAYYQLGDYERTLDFFYNGLEVVKSLPDKEALAKSYNNIGLTLSDLGRLDETIKYHKLSLAIKEELGDESGIANSYSNLGLAYDALDSLDLAMTYYREAFKIDSKLNNVTGLYIVYSNMGNNFFKRGVYDSTMLYYNKAIMLTDEINDKSIKAELLRDYAQLNYKRGEYDRALEKYNESLRLAIESGAQLMKRDAYRGMSEVFEKQGAYAKAYNYYKKYDSINTLLFNEEQSRKIAEMENSRLMKESQREIELLRKESEIKDLRLRNNKYLIYFMVAMIVMIATVVILQYRKNHYKTRTNELLQSQNDEIVEKNNDIMDSMLYAKNIQKAILPSGEKLKKLFKDAFVYSKARDVVNGDFYWFAEKEGKVIIAAVDCTGHGVPAAFLNVLGNSHLSSIVIENNILEPAEILKQLNQRIQKSLSNKSGLETDAGMDIGMCLIDKGTGRVLFAGAKRPLYYFHQKSLEIIKGDGYPVGGDIFEEEREYQQHEIQLLKDDTLYMFTDGIVDQFGGVADKKYMYPQLRALLRNIQEEPMEEQLKHIRESFESWKGSNEQTDDILIIGVKV